MLIDQFEIIISIEKLKDYLLNLQHPDGWGKAKFFRQHGFTTEGDVRGLLLFVISNNEAVQVLPSEYGTKYIVDGIIPSHQSLILRTVWIVLKGENSCRFVTAYPL